MRLLERGRGDGRVHLVHLAAGPERGPEANLLRVDLLLTCEDVALAGRVVLGVLADQVRDRGAQLLRSVNMDDGLILFVADPQRHAELAHIDLFGLLLLLLLVAGKHFLAEWVSRAGEGKVVGGDDGGGNTELLLSLLELREPLEKSRNTGLKNKIKVMSWTSKSLTPHPDAPSCTLS